MSIVSLDRIERRNRRLAGLPREVDPRLSWWRRKVVGPQLWIVLGAVVVFGVGLWLQYREISASLIQEIKAVTEQMGNPTVLTISQFNETLRTVIVSFSATWSPLRLYPGALWTLLVYLLIFFLIDRWRPTTPSMKFLAVGWGAACATLVSLYVNTWASQLAQVEGPVDPTSAVRAAVFIAPFVEEACKASILFFLAIGVRYRLVTPFQVVTLAGLSGVGFAFTENIIYYVRQFIYASKIIGNDPVESMQQIQWLRGVCTSFGHPLFTSLTAVGVLVAVRAHSRLVRILAPLAGYLLAATLHMLFNGFASAEGGTTIVIVGGLVLVAFGLLWLWRQVARQRIRVAWRLDDYVRMGWLQPTDPTIFNTLRYRLKLSVAALLRGRRTFKATVSLIAAITELAYLRMDMVDGLVDEPGLARERELLLDIRALRGVGLDDPVGLKLKPDTWHPVTRLKGWWTRVRSHPSDAAEPAFAPPTGRPVMAAPGWGAVPTRPQPVPVGGLPWRPAV